MLFNDTELYDWLNNKIQSALTDTLISIQKDQDNPLQLLMTCSARTILLRVLVSTIWITWIP